MNGTESQLIKFIDNLNQKHPTIKFEFTYSRIIITKVYKNENRTLCTNIYRKPIDRCNFLHYKSHPKALKDSIPCSQVVRIKGISPETL